ncbi:MAG: hypothetical protein HY275_09050 [Gemmatimonadetes bacterium]|nr:hypothetical protein [Gemmatimonadota bacterium]
MSAPDLGRVVLPMPAWALLVGLRTAMRQRRGEHPDADDRARLASAAAWLTELAPRHATVVAVTHASFRSALVPHLAPHGWTAVGPARSLRHWSAWTFQLADR